MTSIRFMRAVLLFISVFLLFPPDPCLHADELTWVTAEGTASMDRTTLEEAKAAAVRIAEKHAVEKAISQNISAETLLVNLKLSGNIIGSIPYGRVVEKEILEEGTTDINDKGENLQSSVYKVKIKAGIAEEAEGFDPDFRLNATLNKIRFSNNDEMQIRIQPTKECYIFIFNILEDEKILRLIPNQYKTYNRLRANEIFYFPDNIDKSKGLVLIAQTPEGKKMVSESFLILGMKKQLKLDPQNIQEAVSGTNTDKTALMKDLIKNIAGIPLDERGEALIQYEIKK